MGDLPWLDPSDLETQEIISQEIIKFLGLTDRTRKSREVFIKLHFIIPSLDIYYFASSPRQSAKKQTDIFEIVEKVLDDINYGEYGVDPLVTGYECEYTIEKTKKLQRTKPAIKRRKKKAR